MYVFMWMCVRESRGDSCVTVMWSCHPVGMRVESRGKGMGHPLDDELDELTPCRELSLQARATPTKQTRIIICLSLWE